MVLIIYLKLLLFYNPDKKKYNNSLVGLRKKKKLKNILGETIVWSIKQKEINQKKDKDKRSIWNIILSRREKKYDSKRFYRF